MIILRDIELRRGSKLLLEGANVTLQPGQKLALIGANGSGKSSLFAMLLGQLQADVGAIEGMNNLRLAHMAQEVASTDETAGRYVLQGDARLAELTADLAAAETEGDFQRAANLHTAMEDADGYSAERRVQRLLQGLGFADGAAER
ncbi:MAG: ATP-binding cassette domain-containing protein, partial [Haliea sp.]